MSTKTERIWRMLMEEMKQKGTCPDTVRVSPAIYSEILEDLYPTGRICNREIVVETSLSENQIEFGYLKDLE